jgi:hypothetical protein
VFTPLPSGCGIETRQTTGLSSGVRTGGKKERKKKKKRWQETHPQSPSPRFPQTLSDMTPHVRTANRD